MSRRIYAEAVCISRLFPFILLHVQFTPMPLNRSREPFSSPDWVFELKYDGFRALAEIGFGRCRLVSRNGNAFATFHELAP